MKSVDFLDAARVELLEAVEHYNREDEGLGNKFAEEVKRTIERIVGFSNAWTPLSHRTRRCRTKAFPYGIIYQVRENSIVIVAVMHLHRNPESWKSRIGG